MTEQRMIELAEQFDLDYMFDPRALIYSVRMRQYMEAVIKEVLAEAKQQQQQ